MYNHNTTVEKLGSKLYCYRQRNDFIYMQEKGLATITLNSPKKSILTSNDEQTLSTKPYSHSAAQQNEAPNSKTKEQIIQRPLTNPSSTSIPSLSGWGRSNDDNHVHKQTDQHTYPRVRKLRVCPNIKGQIFCPLQRVRLPSPKLRGLRRRSGDVIIHESKNIIFSVLLLLLLLPLSSECRPSVVPIHLRLLSAWTWTTQESSNQTSKSNHSTILH